MSEKKKLELDTPKYLAVLEARRGQWLTTREIVTALGKDPSVDDNRLSAISVLSRLEERHEIEYEFPQGKPTLWRMPLPPEPVDYRDEPAGVPTELLSER